MKRFKIGSAIWFRPVWLKPGEKLDPRHPLKLNELVYFIAEIPNSPSHCIVATYEGKVVPMVHTEDFELAKDDEI